MTAAAHRRHDISVHRPLGKRLVTTLSIENEHSVLN